MTYNNIDRELMYKYPPFELSDEGLQVKCLYEAFTKTRVYKDEAAVQQTTIFISTECNNFSFLFPKA